MTPQAVIELKAVHKQYGPVSAVVDVSLAIGPGELLAIIGPSGAGKSTLLKIVAGEESPSRGEVYIGGRRVTHLAPSARAVAVVYQDYSLFPHLSVSENVGFPLEARAARNLFAFLAGPSSAIREQVATLLERVNLGSHAGKKPDQLSGGEQQRAAIARAIAMNPRLICFDEPFSALDSILRQRLRREVHDLKSASEGAFLYVTHNVEEAFALADRIAVMAKGRIIQSGTPEDLYWHPTSRLVAELTGDVTFLKVASALDEGGAYRCRSAAGTEFVMERLAVQPGDLIGFRPETVAIDSHTPKVRGKVTEISFEGALTRFRVTLVGGEILVVAIPSHLAPVLGLGNEVGLGWDERNCFVISETTTAN